MDVRYDISPHTWILALAIFVIATFLSMVFELSEMSAGMGILGLASQKQQNEVTALRQKLTGEITALRQELASQQGAIDALKASATKSSSTAPTAVSGEGAVPSPRDAQPPKPKPHR
jgi:hypothetical protein